MSTVITDDQFQHIAHLSRLPLNPEDKIIASQLSQAADYVEVLKELNTKDILPTYQVNHKKNVLRKDVIQPSLTQDEATCQSSNNSNGYFVTNATIKK